MITKKSITFKLNKIKVKLFSPLTQFTRTYKVCMILLWWPQVLADWSSIFVQKGFTYKFNLAHRIIHKNSIDVFHFRNFSKLEKEYQNIKSVLSFELAKVSVNVIFSFPPFLDTTTFILQISSHLGIFSNVWCVVLQFHVAAHS